MARKKHKYTVYEQDFIEKIVKLKLEGKTYGYLTNKYNIPKGTISTWIQKRKATGNNIRLRKGKRKKPENQTIEDLRIENEILKKFQAFLNQQQDEK